MYVRFPLSLRNVEDLLFERGIDICQRRAVLAEPVPVTKTRDKSAALAFIEKAMKRHGRAETITTDGRPGRRLSARRVAQRIAG